MVFTSCNIMSSFQKTLPGSGALFLGQLPVPPPPLALLTTGYYKQLY